MESTNCKACSFAVAGSDKNRNSSLIIRKKCDRRGHVPFCRYIHIIYAETLRKIMLLKLITVLRKTSQEKENLEKQDNHIHYYSTRKIT